MGEIIFWTMIRITIVIPILWVAEGYINYELWWLISIMILYGVIIHPAIIHYRLFEEKNKDIIESTLCSTCLHFDKSAVLCMKYDKHPTKEYLPCDGIDWEPKSSDIDNYDIFKS